MKRDIKFKAYDRKSGYWLFFSLLELTNGGATNFLETLENWCEFTGLKDRKGAEIYEGDIVRQELRKDAQVFFRSGSFCTYIDEGRWIEMSNNSLDFEVIGNIYENKLPEYLSV